MKRVFDFNLFKSVYFLFCILYVFPATMEICVSLSKFFLIWGLLVLILDIIRNILAKNNAYFNAQKRILLLFQILVLFSAVINVNNLSSHLILIAYSIIQTFILSDERNKYSIHVFWIYVVFSLITSIGSLLIFFSNFKNTFTINGIIMPFGLYDGRLYGIFSNPNNTSLVAWISIVVSIYIFYFVLKTQKKGFLKLLLVINIIINIIVLALGNSRSILIMLLVFGFLVTQIIMGKSKVLLRLGVSFCVLIGLYLGTSFSNNVMLMLQTHILNESVIYKTDTEIHMSDTEQYQNVQVSPSSTQNDQGENGNNVDISDNTDSLDRDNIGSYERSGNERIAIYKTGIKTVISSLKILLFGVGNNNILSACRMIDPSVSELYANMHNIYLQVLLGSGIFSLITFLALFIYLGAKVLNKRSSETYFWGSVCFAYLVSGLFDSNLLYFMNLLGTASFWFFLGMLNNSLDNKSDND
mgnify:CR=1 FL=1